MTLAAKKNNDLPRIFAAITRDLVLFVVGIGLIVHEAVLRDGPERTALLILYGGMVGLPAILRADEARRERNGEDV